MFFIVIYHILYHGVHLKETIIVPNVISIPNYVISQYILTICSTCVNLYVLITGYFLFDKTFKSVRFIKVWFLALFYGFVIAAIIHIINPEKVAMLDVIYSLRPMAFGKYWFVKQYLGLLIAAPLLGYVAKNITQKQYKILLLVIIVLGTDFTCYIGSFPFGQPLCFNQGFSFIWFVCLFFTGAYIRRFGFRFNSFHYFFFFSIIVCVYTLGRIFLVHCIFGNDFHFSNYDYNGAPYILAILFFSWIRNIHIKENILTSLLLRMAPYTFAVYLIHDNKFVRSYLYGLGGVTPDLINSEFMIPWILLFSVIVFLTCILIDIIRDKIFYICGIEKIQSLVSIKIDNWIDRLIRKFD